VRRQGDAGVSLRDVLAALWRRRLILEVTIGVSVIIGVAIVALQGPRYRADAQVLLTQPQTASAGDLGLATQQKLTLIAVNFAKIVSAPQFVDDAARAAGITPGDASVSADNPLNVAIVHITARSSSRSRAVAVAQAVQDHFRQTVEQSQAGLAADARMSTVPLQLPTGRFTSINPVFTIFAALTAGFAISATVALLLESP
jgi:capsular polysaccharide biosynthesis protein